MKPIIRLGMVATLVLGMVGIAAAPAAAAPDVPPLTWGPYVRNQSMINFPVTAPGGEVTTECIPFGTTGPLTTYDNSGTAVRQILKTPQVQGKDNCVMQPHTDAEGDIYGVLFNSDILVGYSTSGTKWSLDLNCGTDYQNKVVVGGNGRIYTVAMENSQLKVWGIAPDVTPPAAGATVVDNFAIPGSCSTISLLAYKDGLLIGNGGAKTYYNYAGKKLHSPAELPSAPVVINADGDAFYLKQLSGGNYAVQKLSARWGTVLWTYELPIQQPYADIFPTSDGGAVVKFTGTPADQIPPGDIPYVNQTTSRQLVFLDEDGDRSRLLFVRQPDGSTNLTNGVEVTPDVDGNVVLTYSVLDQVGGVDYRKLAVQVMELSTGNVTFTEELRGDVNGPSPYGFDRTFDPVMLSDDIVYLPARCSSPNFTMCDSTPQFFPITATMVGMDYPRGTVLAANTANQPAPKKYVALGDSFASGLGNPPYLTGTAVPNGNDCRRAVFGYPVILGQDPKSSLRLDAYAACAGAKTDHITNDWTNGNAGEGPQVGEVDGDTDVVTLSIGGNDIGFADFVAGCFTNCVAAEATARYKLDNELGPKLDDAYRAILTSANNDADVYVLGYPPMLSGSEDLCFTSNPFANTTNRQLAMDLHEDLNQKIKDTVEALDNTYPRLHFVDTADSGSAFVGHEFCSDVPYFNWVDIAKWSDNFHPTFNGSIAYAIELTKDL